MTNLLQNGDFEGGVWQETFTGQTFNEISAPEHWVVFWREGGVPLPHDPQNPNGYRRPETRVIRRVPPYLDPPRILQGEQAWQCFTFYGIHDAGLYQRVEGIEPGTRLRAAAWTHAWSSNSDNPHQSETSGGGQWNFTQTVGLDPSGGTDPWAESVVWSEPRNVYDAYAQLPPVEVEAEAEAVTVFIRSVVMWPFKHCDCHWDDITLEVVDEEPPEPGPEPPQPPQGPPALADIEIAVEPATPRAGEIFNLRVRKAAWIAFVRLTFEGGEVFRAEPEVAGEDLLWRCLAFAPGSYVVQALAGNVPLALQVLEVEEP